MLTGLEVTGANCLRNPTFLAVSRGALTWSLAAASSSPDESTKNLLQSLADQQGSRPHQIARLRVVFFIELFHCGFAG
jgi:hypothetical protein